MARGFNGSSDLIAVATAGSLSFERTDLFSVSAWVNMTAVTAAQHVIVSKLQGSNSTGWEFNGNFNTGQSNVQLYLISNFGTNNYLSVRSTGTVSAGTYLNLGFTYSGSSNINGVTFYISGSAQTNVSIRDTLSATIISTAAVNFGARPGGSNFMFGSMADIAVWNVVLTAAEMAALAKGARPKNIRPKSLSAYLPLDGLSSPEPDFSGSVINGTLTGTTLANGPPVAMFTSRWPQSVLPTSVPSAALFRKTSSRIGTRTGTRQTWAA